MNKILKRLRGRNIKYNLKQFLSVIFIVLLSTMLLSGLITSSFTLNSAVDEYFEKTNLADIWVQTDVVSEADEAFLNKKNIEYDKRIYFESTAEIRTLQKNNSAKIYIYKGKVSTPYIETGKKGCLIDKNVARNHHIKAGFDNINFSYSVVYQGKEYILDFEERLTGTMCLDECADSYSSWAIMIDEDYFFSVVKSKLKNKINDFDETSFSLVYNQILIKTDDVEKTSKDLKEYYELESTQSELVNLYDRNSIESVNLLKEEINQSRKMIYVFPIIFLVVSVLVILTSIDQLVIQERKRIGILKSCGVPNKKILKHYSLYGAILCFIGSTIGTFLGPLIISDVMFAKYGTIYSIPTDYIVLKIPYLWILLMIFGIVLLGYLVSIFSCYKILHKNPVECFRFELNAAAKKLKNQKKHYKKVPIPLKMAIRNIKTKTLRTIMTTIGIAGCVALLVAGFGVNDTLNKSLDNDLGGVFKYDVLSTYANEDFKQNLAKDERVEFVEDFSRVYVKAEANQNISSAYLYEVQADSKITSFKLIKNEVCISSSIAESLGLKVGDIFKVEVFGKTITLSVNQIVETSVLNGIYVCRDLGFEQNVKTQGVWIKCKSDASGLAEFANTINGTNTALTLDAQRSEIEGRIMSTSTLIATIKVFAILLAIVVLLNVILLIIKERSTEIATLKVMGLNSFEISLSIFIEIILMAGIGMIFGMILGYPLLIWILAVNKISIINFVVGIKFLSFLLSMLIILGTIFTVLLICFFKIKKIDMCGVLKNVE